MEHAIALGAVLFVFLCSFIQPMVINNANPSLDVSIRTDKASYNSSEPITISVSVRSMGCAGSASLAVLGIRPSSTAYINQSITAMVAPGVNAFSFNATAPRCTRGCGGVYPGPYNITAEVNACGVTAHAETVITLVV